MYTFTRSLAASGALILVVAGVTLVVIASMTGLGWTLGPFEVISLIGFLGYSLTYCIHVAHTFVMAKGVSPLRALELAMLRIGPATVVSALTTMSTCVFLGICTIRVFNKFGIVLFLTTLVGLVAALTALPCCLLVSAKVVVDDDPDLLGDEEVARTSGAFEDIRGGEPLASPGSPAPPTPGTSEEPLVGQGALGDDP